MESSPQIESDPEIIQCAEVGDIDRISEILALDKESHKQTDEMGFTALHCATNLGEPELVKLLLEAGADPNAESKFGITPLHLVQVPADIEALVNAGAFIKHKSKDGSTPLLTLASEPDSFWCMKKLLQLGADPNSADNFGVTPIEVAKERGEMRKVVLLRAFGGIDSVGSSS